MLFGRNLRQVNRRALPLQRIVEVLRKPSGASPPECGRNGDHQGAPIDRGQGVDRYPPCDAEHYYGTSGLPPEVERVVTPRGRGREDQSEHAYSEQRQAKN